MKSIIVPISNAAQTLLDVDQADSSDLCEETLTQDEFLALWNSGLLNEINDQCNTWIDEYEDASICAPENLNKLLTLLEAEMLKQKLPQNSGIDKLLSMAKRAKEHKTGIYFYF